MPVRTATTAAADVAQGRILAELSNTTATSFPLAWAPPITSRLVTSLARPASPDGRSGVPITLIWIPVADGSKVTVSTSTCPSPCTSFRVATDGSKLRSPDEKVSEACSAPVNEA